jgi:hypothetical protein
MRSRGRRAAFFVGVAAAIVLARPGGVRVPVSSPDAAIAEAMAERGLACAPADVTWVDRPRGLVGTALRSGLALVRAHSTGELDDCTWCARACRPRGRYWAWTASTT